MSRIVVIGTEGELGRAIASRFAELGGEVLSIPLASPCDLESLAARLAGEPIDLLIFTDDYAPPARHAEEVTRNDLQHGLLRLVFTPFRLAALLKPQLTGGKAVLVTRRSALMTAPDTSGRYLERPFRAAAHQLWRSLAAEWPKAGIACLLIAIDDPDSIAELPHIIDTAPNGIMIDSFGKELGW